jgi:hypothetical protein
MAELHRIILAAIVPRERIDHNGIDDAFLEKASITWYWYKGRWMQLQGAD